MNVKLHITPIARISLQIDTKEYGSLETGIFTERGEYEYEPESDLINKYIQKASSLLLGMGLNVNSIKQFYKISLYKTVGSNDYLGKPYFDRATSTNLTFLGWFNGRITYHIEEKDKFNYENSLEFSIIEGKFYVKPLICFYSGGHSYLDNSFTIKRVTDLVNNACLKDIAWINPSYTISMLNKINEQIGANLKFATNYKPFIKEDGSVIFPAWTWIYFTAFCIKSKAYLCVDFYCGDSEVQDVIFEVKINKK